MHYIQKATNQWFTPSEKVVIKNIGDVPLYVFFDMPTFNQTAKLMNKQGVSAESNGSSLLDTIEPGDILTITDILVGALFYVTTDETGKAGTIQPFNITV